MNQNLSYSSYSDPRGNNGQPPQQQQQQQQQSNLPFHAGYQQQSSTYTTSTTPFAHGSSSFIPGSSEYKMPPIATTQSQPQTKTPQVQFTPSSNVESDDRRIAALLDSYFVDTPNVPAWSQSGGLSSGGGHVVQPASSSLSSSYSLGSLGLSHSAKGAVKLISPEKQNKERVKRLKQAEAARQRYHRLSNDQKKDLNMKRTMAQKRKRQREKELEELEQILRQSNDIQEDPEVTDQLRERRMRAKWAEAARARYQRMTSEERRAHNNKRRMRQMQNAINATKESGILTGDPVKDDEAVRRHIKEANNKKAEAARSRYHRMSDDEKRSYNQRRTEAFRRRRMEEEMLLAMPIGRINGEALDRAQQIVVRNAKRAEAARLRYQRMTPDQRKMYNQASKRYTPKRKRLDGSESMDEMIMPGMTPTTTQIGLPPKKKQQQQYVPDEDMDALSTLERDVMKRTQQAQQQLARQQTNTSRSTYSALNSVSSALQQQSSQQTLAQHLGQVAPSASQQNGAPLISHHVQPQPMPSYGSAAGNQGIMGGHMQPILNPYGARP